MSSYRRDFRYGAVFLIQRVETVAATVEIMVREFQRNTPEVLMNVLTIDIPSKKMKHNRVVRIYSIACLMLVGLAVLLTSSLVNAQGAGKISAKVIDAKTGEAIARATVKIIETKQRAYTKDSGIATVINVAPSEQYTVVASFIGYRSRTVTNVKVLSDMTTLLAFRLSRPCGDALTNIDQLVVEKAKSVSSECTASQVVSTPGRQRYDDIIRLAPGVYIESPVQRLSSSVGLGTVISLEQNTPNPFLDYTTIRYTLPSDCEVSLMLYDLMGHEVRMLDEGPRAAGHHDVTINRDGLRSGAYWYVLATPSGMERKKVMVLDR